MTTFKTCIFSLVFFCGIFSCRSQNNINHSEINYPLEVTDEYSKVERIVFSNNMGTFYYYHLKAPKVVQGFPCTGKFRIGTDGKIYEFVLSKDHKINGTLIPEGSLYHQYSEETYLIALSKDITIQAYPVYHKETGIFNENNVEFYKDGSLAGFYLAENMIIDNLPCRGGKKNSNVMLYKNGKLKYCNLSENKEINGIPCKGGQGNRGIWLDPDNKIISCFLSKNFKIDGKLYAEDTKMIFDKEGKVHHLSGNIDYIHFYEKGGILNCVLTNDIEIDGKLIMKKSRVLFYENGSLMNLRPHKNILINGIPCMKKKFMTFHPNGKLKKCILSEDLEIDGIKYKKGDQIRFENNENVIKTDKQN